MISYYLYSAVPVLIGIGILVVAGYYAWNRRRGEKETLRNIARTLGFKFSEPESSSSFVRLIGDWEMAGTYNRIPVRIYGKKVSGDEGSSESTFIDATASCRTKFELVITRETAVSRLAGALFGMQDVKTGNEDLDRRVVVKGVPAHVVKRVIDHPELQRELLRLFEHDGSIHVDLHGAHYQQSAVFKDEQAVRSLLDALTRTAAALEKATA
jgi:hypothetical protein